MSVRNLDHLFRPKSIALIGASDRPQSVGATVMRKLLEGGFTGPVWPVNASHRTVAGRPAFRDVASLPQPPDLAVICTPAPTVPGLIEALGHKRTRAAVVISAGLSATTPTAPAGPACARPCSMRRGRTCCASWGPTASPRWCPASA